MSTCAVRYDVGAGRVGSVVKKFLLVALVIVVLFTGIPLVMSMSMGGCADCDEATMASSICLAVLAAAAALFLAAMALRYRAGSAQLRGRLAPFALERPPRLA